MSATCTAKADGEATTTEREGGQRRVTKADGEATTREREGGQRRVSTLSIILLDCDAAVEPNSPLAR